ncbi:FIG039767: hypothetical protein [hydrothermal vent metagenome]|uniref:DUF4194 domain-containing protein n=1 Tax=hydrothermal vent metagenome TaxID=652676 RepID=A0A3B0WTF5_9ZZZZ
MANQHETLSETDNENLVPGYDQQTKRVAQELIKTGIVEMVNKPNYYQHCLHHKMAIEQILSPLDLKLGIDDVRGLVFVLVGDKCKQGQGDEPANEPIDELMDDWQHPLVRRQRMNLEQSLLLAILRQHFVAHEMEAGVGDQKALVFLDDLLPQLNQFLGATGSDEKENKRLRQLLDQLKSYGLVSDIDDNERVTIRPLIAHVANPENLKNLIAALKKHIKEQEGGEQQLSEKPS